MLASQSLVSLEASSEPGICNEAALRDALNGTNAPAFKCDGTIRLTAPLVIDKDVTLDATGRDVVFDGGCTGASMFVVTPTGRLTLRNVTLTNGCGSDGAAIRIEQGAVVLERVLLSGNSANGVSLFGGGAILNHGGQLVATNCVWFGNQCLDDRGDASGGALCLTTNAMTILEGCRLENNRVGMGPNNVVAIAPAARGGALYNAGTLSLRRCIFVRNSAAGRPGQPAFVSGLRADPGGDATGGALDTRGRVMLSECSFLSNNVTGGGGAQDSDGQGAGVGGAASGAALYVEGSGTLLASTFAFNSARGGLGGRGFNSLVGISSAPATPGGRGGAAWGTVCLRNAMVAVTNCTLCANSVSGSDGGRGGTNSSSRIYSGPPLNGGMGGDGADAGGGGIFVLQAEGALVNCTIASNAVHAGTGMPGGTGTCSRFGGCLGPAASGTNGIAAGGGIAASSPDVALLNSILAFNSGAPNASGPWTDLGHNLSSDSSGAGPGGLLNLDPRLGPLADYGGPTWTMVLLFESPALDAGDRTGTPPADQRGVVREFGPPDIGAFESQQPRLSLRLLGESVEVRVQGPANARYPILVSGDLHDWSIAGFVQLTAAGVGVAIFPAAPRQFFAIHLAQ